jgi:pimeloyl-ACP methyl ester carboxylesterase
MAQNRRRRTLWLLLAIVAVGLAVLTAWIFVPFQRDLARIRVSIASLPTQIVDTRCGRIEYLEQGSGSPILIVHGIWGGVDQGLLNVRGVLEANSHTIVVSRFGYLGSPLPERASVEGQADLYACLIEQLGIGQVTVVAHSAGVTSALQLALRHPELVKAIVLISPNAPGEVEVKAPPRAIAEIAFRSDLLFWWLGTYGTTMLYGTMGVPQDFQLSEDQRSYVADMAMTVLPASRRYKGALFDMYTSNPAVNEYPIESVRVPTLVVSARDDPMALYRNAVGLAERIPSAELLTLETGGHMLLGNDDAIASRVRRFVATHDTLAVER